VQKSHYGWERKTGTPITALSVCCGQKAVLIMEVRFLSRVSAMVDGKKSFYTLAYNSLHA
jgi:hypothetical protein